MMPADRRLHFGNATRLREESREAWSLLWLAQLWQDLSYGARVLRRAPGFTLGAVTILALGVGVNLAEFQMFDAIIFHRLTIQDANSALQFSRVSRQGPSRGFPSAAIEFYRSESSSFAWLVSEDTSLGVIVEGETGLRSSLVSGNYFGSLGIVPAWGRLLDARDAQPGAPPAAVLGYDYWQSHWAADPPWWVASFMSTITCCRLWAYCLTALTAYRSGDRRCGFPSPFARSWFPAALLSSRIFHARPICFSAS
jgi:hypothetical protein